MAFKYAWSSQPLELGWRNELLFGFAVIACSASLHSQLLRHLYLSLIQVALDFLSVNFLNLFRIYIYLLCPLHYFLSHHF